MAPPGGSHTRLGDLLEGWAKESNPAQSTIDLWRSHVAGFTSYVGNDDARSIQRGDVIKWKQHLIELGNTPKTINDSKLAALKTIFRWGMENEVVPHNPATGVTIRRTKKSGERMLGFELEEAAVILKAAVKQANPAYRWVPLLCAQSGARVSEICQLRREDIRCEDRIWFMHLRPEAGAMKTIGSERRVPLHPMVQDLGFIDFVKERGVGPLFFDPSKRRAGAKKPQPKIVAKNVARWVHSLDIKVGLHVRKAPNHAWRHFFRTSARDVGIEESVTDAILGHAAGSVGRGYGETRLSTAARAIARMPLPGLGEIECG